MGRIDDSIAKGLAGVSIWSSRHARTVIAVTFVVTVVFAYGVSTITTNVDVADVLPRGNPNTDAAHNLTERFRSTFTQQATVQLHIDTTGDRWRADNELLQYRVTSLVLGSSSPLPPLPSLPNLPIPLPLPEAPVELTLAPDANNITDEVYVRATEEFADFIKAHTDFKRSVGIPFFYGLINWTVAGGYGGPAPASPDAAQLPSPGTPDGAQLYLIVDQVVKAAIPYAVDAVASPSWNHAAILFLPASDNQVPTPELGRQILKARDDYVQAVCEGKTTYTVFADCKKGAYAGTSNKPLFTVDLPIANAHSSELVEEDTVRLMPLVAAYILVLLYIAFRNVRAIVVSFATLATGVVWSYGTMGFMGIALNTLNMTIVPLVMGIGIDYSIHMINEFVEHKSEGHTDAEAFRIAGSRSGVAMLIATATTVGGLATLIFSPSLLIAELGIVSTVALTVIYLLAITFIPAALTLVGGSDKMGQSFSRSRIMPAVARGISKARVVVLILIIGISALAFVGTDRLHKEAFGDPGRNYLPDDPIRREHEEGLAKFYESANSDEKTNVLAFQGPGVLTPDAMQYYRAIEANLRTKDRIIQDTLRTLPFIIETWDTVKGGGVGAGQNLVIAQLIGSGALPDTAAAQVDPFPATEEAIRTTVTQMFDSPIKELASVFVNYPTAINSPELGMTALTFGVRAATYEEASLVWDQVWSAVEEANRTFGGHAPNGISVAFVGNTATNYLFIAEELPWLTYMNIVDNIMLVVLVFVMTRSIKTTLVTLLLSTLTSLWWLALLPFFGIGLAITLVLPMAFIVAIGTDYGIHFMWNIKQTGNAREVFESTGKAVLFSAITTTGAFTFFIFLQNVAVARTMLATTIAFVVIFVVTLLTVPVFFKVREKGWLPPAGSDHTGGGYDAAQAPTPSSAPVRVATRRRK